MVMVYAMWLLSVQGKLHYRSETRKIIVVQEDMARICVCVLV